MNSGKLIKSTTADSAQSYLSSLNADACKVGGQITFQQKLIATKPSEIGEYNNKFQTAVERCSADHLSDNLKKFITKHPTEGTMGFLETNSTGTAFKKTSGELEALVMSREEQVDALKSVMVARKFKEQVWESAKQYNDAVNQNDKLRALLEE